MNNPIKPKLTPRPEKNLAPAPVKTPQKEEGETTGVNHVAMLSGLGLLGEIAEIGEHLSTMNDGRQDDGTVKAVDPRDQVDPRKRFLPR